MNYQTLQNKVNTSQKGFQHAQNLTKGSNISCWDQLDISNPIPRPIRVHIILPRPLDPYNESNKDIKNVLGSNVQLCTLNLDVPIFDPTGKELLKDIVDIADLVVFLESKHKDNRDLTRVVATILSLSLFL